MAKKTTQKKINQPDLVHTVVDGMLEKKASQIVYIDLRAVQNSICDYFVICHANSPRQVAAIADSIKKEVMEKMNDKPVHTEGYQNGEWILLDFFNVIAHVFLKDKRFFYQMEELWADGVFHEITPEETLPTKTPTKK